MTKSNSSENTRALFRQVAKLYEYYDHRHALAILRTDFVEELCDVCSVLLNFQSLVADEKHFQNKRTRNHAFFSDFLRPMGWGRARFTSKLFLNFDERYLDTNSSIDWFKNRVAFDAPRCLSKSGVRRTLDRYAKFFEHEQLSVGIIVAQKPDIRNYLDNALTSGTHDFRPMKTADVLFATTPSLGTLAFKLSSRISAGCPILTFIPRSATD